MTPSDERLARILLQTRTIALVGASVRADRPSNAIGRYLRDAGYRVIPVNPGHAGKTLFGETVVAQVSDIADPVDLINVFRRSESVSTVVEQALFALPGLKTIWMQSGVSNAAARALAEAAGLQVVENRCIKVEHARLLGRKAR